MIERSASSAPPRHRAAFWLWGWAMLLVIMLSAAPTGGALRTQLFGSAFDPATYSVTTAPKRHASPAELQTESKGEPDEAPALDYPQPVDALAFVAAPAGHVRADGPRPMSAHVASAHVIADNRAARAPPSK